MYFPIDQGRIKGLLCQTVIFRWPRGWVWYEISSDGWFLFQPKTTLLSTNIFSWSIGWLRPPKFNISPLKSYRDPIGKDRLPFPPFFSENVKLRRCKVSDFGHPIFIKNKIIPSGKLTWLAGISPFLIGNISSIRVHFPASYVRLPERNPQLSKDTIILA